MKSLDCIQVLKALSELPRMRIVRDLLDHRLSVQELAERLDMSQYNVSKHLRILREAGLVRTEREGKRRISSIGPALNEHLARNRNVLELKCCTFRFDHLPK